MELCDEVAKDIEARGGRALPYLADVRGPVAVKAMVDATIEAFGGVDIVVHNAATRGNVSIGEMDFDTYFKSIDASINGMFRLVKAGLPSMKPRGGGSIVDVGGITSTKGAPARAHVGAAKLRLAPFVRALAHDLGQHQICANLVVVGAFDTDRSSPSAATVSPAANANIQLGHKGSNPQDLADLIRFVVGPNATYISGETIHRNGVAYMNL